MVNNMKTLKTIRFSEFYMWDVKRFLKSSITSNHRIVDLKNFIVQRSEKVKLYEFKEDKFGILGVNNKIGVFDAYTEKGSNLNQAYKFVKNNDLAYNPYRVNVGSIGWKTKNQKNEYISPAYVVFSCENGLNPEFLYRMFKTDTFNKIINDNTTGSVRQNLKFSTLSNIKIPLPSLTEQNEIVANYNTKVQLAKQQEEQAIQLEKDLSSYIDQVLEIEENNEEIEKAGLFLKLIKFSSFDKWGVDTQSNSKVNYQKEFEQSKISQICSISSGGTPSRSRKEYYTGTIPWIKTGEVINDEIFETGENITEEAIKNSSAKLYKKGSLIIAMYGQGKTRGRTAKLGVDATTNQACAVLYDIDNSKILTDYLWVFLQNEYNRLRELASGNSQPNLNAQMIKNYPVVIPPMKIQKKIISTVSNLKLKIKDLKIQVEKNQTKAIKEFEQEIFITD